MDDDEEIQLQPANFYDKPNKRESIRDLLRELGSTNEDAAWNNLAPFLTGLRMSKYELPVYFYEKVTRKACEVGKERIILTCAERAEETGFTLKKKGVTRELMLGLHTRAAQHNFTGPELESAARRAEKIARMLENELHGAEKLQKDEEDPRKDALVISVLAEIAAAKALNAAGSVDHAANYATRMLHLSTEAANGAYAREVPATSKEDVRIRAEKNSELETLLPLQNAIKLALGLDSIKQSPLGKDLAAHLKTVNAKVKEALKKLSTLSDGKPRRGQLIDVQSTLQTTRHVFSSYLRIRTLSTSATSPELQQSRAELRSNLETLTGDLADLLESVSAVESDPYRFGLDVAEVQRRRQFVKDVGDEVEGMRRELEDVTADTHIAGPAGKLPQPAAFQDDANMDDDPYGEFEAQQQATMMAEQDEQLDGVFQSVGVLRGQAEDMGRELEEQGHMLDEVDTLADRVGGKLNVGVKKVGEVIRKNEDTVSSCCIAVLIVVLIILLILVIVI
ncbi:hypothetical protein LTS07_003531 [Exophiala sideris]|uniref:t-SNARE coiled-coil homology domain-containing protein n=1 Tax=Exophiala sideris TaxID=1016849 RepID=A0ABR0JGI1_9EURO|nr:hypothetical protein LTS07_003531 [Exophiala sideris]KAK5063774.1 hypothetical protein LTR69_003539 [Exophiala sideris]